jgi:hypothetical protein
MQDAPPDHVVFSVGPAQYRLSDIVRTAGHWGDLTALEQTVRYGLACVKQATETDTAPTSAEIEAAASEFRYDRDLIAADEMQAWLDRWGLPVEGWTAYLQRSLLRRRWPGELDRLLSGHPVSDSEVVEVLHVEGICSGQYGRVAHTLAARLATAERAREEGWLGDGGSPEDGPDDHALLDTAVQRLAAHVVTPQAVRAEVASRHLDWVRLDCELVSFADVHRAREAVLCVREDGRALDQVAADAGGVLRRGDLWLEDVEPSWRTQLLSARAGDVVGPLRGSESFVVLSVRRKVLPVLEDPEIRRRAETSLLDRALEQESAGRVRWHHRL